jgi:phenylalanine-4-hydroxylase
MSSSLIPQEFIAQQDLAKYSKNDHRAWSTLFTRRMAHLQHYGSERFHRGLAAIALQPDRIPDIEAMSDLLEARTGWRAVAVTDFLEPKHFFRCLSARRFPTAITIRSLDSLDYVAAPDIFHDVFGHVPLHADPVFADFLQRFGQTAANAPAHSEEAFTRLFWYTVEFGLIRERSGCKVYGSGLISSHADCINALSDGCQRRRFDLQSVVGQSFRVDTLQPILFEINDFSELFNAVEEMAEERLARNAIASNSSPERVSSP